MVKSKRKRKSKLRQAKKSVPGTKKRQKKQAKKSRKLRINANTPYDVSSERMTAFGGIL